jgi:hypothetical protein
MGRFRDGRGRHRNGMTHINDVASWKGKGEPEGWTGLPRKPLGPGPQELVSSGSNAIPDIRQVSTGVFPASRPWSLCAHASSYGVSPLERRIYCSAPKSREKKCPMRWKKPGLGVFGWGAAVGAMAIAVCAGSGSMGTGLEPGGGRGGGGGVMFEGDGAGAAGEGAGMAADAVSAGASPLTVSLTVGRLPLKRKGTATSACTSPGLATGVAGGIGAGVRPSLTASGKAVSAGVEEGPPTG